MSTPKSSSSNTRTKERISEIIGISEAIRHNSEVEDGPGYIGWLNETIEVKRNHFDGIIDILENASNGISCINRIMRDSLDEDLPSWLEHLHCNSTKGPLHGAIEVLTDVIEQQRQKILDIVCEAEEVKS